MSTAEPVPDPASEVPPALAAWLATLAPDHRRALLAGAARRFEAEAEPGPAPEPDPPPPDRLDERALRRADFGGGVPVVLWDGQAWTLARPVVVGFAPRRNPATGRLDPAAQLDQGADYDALVDAWFAATTTFEQIAAEFDLAAHLLQRNYALADADLPRLLYRPAVDHPRYEDGLALWEQVREVALGRAPKPSAAGSG